MEIERGNFFVLGNTNHEFDIILTTYNGKPDLTAIAMKERKIRDGVCVWSSRELYDQREVVKVIMTMNNDVDADVWCWSWWLVIQR